MLIATLVMALLAAGLLFIAYRQGEGQHLRGLKTSLVMIVEILPLLIFAFIVAGLVQVLLPQETVARWIGGESGIRGILIGSLAGGFAPGGPYVSLPAELGVCLTQDYMPLLGPEIYRVFELPRLKRIAEAFGGVYIHCCGEYARHLPALRDAGFGACRNR